MPPIKALPPTSLNFTLHMKLLIKRAPLDEAADNSKWEVQVGGWEVRGGVVSPAIHTGLAAPAQVMRELSCGCRSEKACVKRACDCQSIKTHHYIICFVRALHSKPGMESFC